MSELIPRPIGDRVRLADRVRSVRHAVSVAVTDALLTRDPAWPVHYGERARALGVDDAGFHLDFLAASLEAGDPATFAEHARWTARVLASRGVPSTFLEATLEQLGRALAASLEAPARPVVAGLIRAGKEAVLAPCPPDAGLDAGRGDAGRGDAGRGDPREGVAGAASVAVVSGGARSGSAGPAGAEPAPMRVDLAGTRRVFLDAVLHGARPAAKTILLEALRAGIPPLDIYDAIIEASLVEIGRLWERNRITVAQEHMATAIIEYLLSVLYERQERAATTRGRAVLTSVPGELHTVGAHVVSDALEVDGWDVRYLGANVPVADVIEVVKEHRPSVLGISATMLVSIPGARALADEVARRLGARRPRLIVGGAAFRLVPALAAELGADAAAFDLGATLAAFRAVPPAPSRS